MMKRNCFGILMLVLLLGMVVADVQAQQGQGQGQGQGRGMGPGGRMGGRGFGGGGTLLCDVLMLKADKAEEVQTIYNEVQQQQIQAMRDSGTNPRDLSQEERIQRMQKMQEEMAAALKKALAGKLSEDELKVAEKVIGIRARMQSSELSALRLIDLKDEQRVKLQPIALKYVEAVQAATPQRTPGQGGPGQGPSEEELAQLQKLNAAFIDSASELLTDEQLKAWDAKTKELEAEREQRRQEMRQGRGGGQGGPQGQGQRGQGGQG